MHKCGLTAFPKIEVKYLEIFLGGQPSSRICNFGVLGFNIVKIPVTYFRNLPFVPYGLIAFKKIKLKMAHSIYEVVTVRTVI